MKTLITSSLLAALLTFAIVAESRAQTTAFTYQGRLTQNGAPYSGPAEMRFSLFSAPVGGTAVATNAPSLMNVNVSNGLFTAALDFGATTFSGADRWLEIQVRTGLGAFDTLNPRQPLTPTPYAVTALNALNVIGADRHSLDALDGSPADSVLVDNAGNVGVGTATPVSRLHVVSPSDADFPPRLESSSTTRFNAGWDFYHGGIGKGYVGVPDASAVFAPGEMLVFGGPGVPVSLWAGQTRALTVMPDGDVQLGANGQFHAASGEENLRIVRGTVSGAGAVLAGIGFQMAHEPGGRYVIAFNTPFAAPPTVTCSGIFNGPTAPVTLVHGTQAGSASISSSRVGGGDESFYFIAVGPR